MTDESKTPIEEQNKAVQRMDDLFDLSRDSLVDMVIDLEAELGIWEDLVWQLREEMKYNLDVSYLRDCQKRSTDWLDRLTEMLEECGLEMPEVRK